MATNNFKPFATAANANVMPQANWEALPALLSGFTSGKAASAEVNKALRQATTISAMIGQFIAKTGVDALDNGDISALVTRFSDAIIANLSLASVVRGDACTVAGFLYSSEANPYLHNSITNNDILLATRADLGTKQPLDNTLTALASLVGTANKIPYFTGTDIAALADFTQVARDILAKSSVADINTYLGLKSAAVRDVGTAANQIPDMSSFPSGSNWFKLPDGTIVQKGTSVAGAIGSPTFINFPVAFTNYSTVQIVMSYDNAASAVTFIPSFAATPVSTGLGFSLMGSQPSGSNTTYCRWIAIGK